MPMGALQAHGVLVRKSPLPPTLSPKMGRGELNSGSSPTNGERGLKMVQVSLRRLGGGLPLQEERIDEGFDLSAQDLLHVAGLQAGPMVLHKLVGGKDVRTDLAAPGGVL